jgi:hypothetical protein
MDGASLPVCWLSSSRSLLFGPDGPTTRRRSCSPRPTASPGSIIGFGRGRSSNGPSGSSHSQEMPGTPFTVSTWRSIPPNRGATGRKCSASLRSSARSSGRRGRGENWPSSLSLKATPQKLAGQGGAVGPVLWRRRRTDSLLRHHRSGLRQNGPGGGGVPVSASDAEGRGRTPRGFASNAGSHRAGDGTRLSEPGI